MVDDKEVDLEEDQIQKENNELNRVPSHNLSLGNTSSSQWTNNTNSYKCNPKNSIIASNNSYLELQRTANSENPSTAQEHTGGKIANYNRSSGIINNVSLDPYQCDLTSNQTSINRLNPSCSRNPFEQQNKGK